MSAPNLISYLKTLKLETSKLLILLLYEIINDVLIRNIIYYTDYIIGNIINFMLMSYFDSLENVARESIVNRSRK